jgi:hypothetical protein
MLEHMKRFQGLLEGISRDVKEVKNRLSQVEIGLASIRGDIAHLAGDQARQQVTMDGLADRIERIERRLELA